MSSFFKIFIFVITGIALAIISNYFFTGWYNIIPWAIVSIFIGYISSSRKNIFINGALFGYSLFVCYILLGYDGKADIKSIMNIIIFSLLFSLIGAAAGIIGAFIGNFLRKKISVHQNAGKINNDFK